MVIIDDKKEDCESIRHALADLIDFSNITVFETGRKALDALTRTSESAPGKNSRPPKLILLDFDLPRMQAPEVVAALRASAFTRFVPIVVFSDSRATKDMRASYESGANGFVCKPVDFVEFQETVTLLGRYWIEFNQYPP